MANNSGAEAGEASGIRQTFPARLQLLAVDETFIGSEDQLDTLLLREGYYIAGDTRAHATYWPPLSEYPEQPICMCEDGDECKVHSGTLPSTDVNIYEFFTDSQGQKIIVQTLVHFWPDKIKQIGPRVVRVMYVSPDQLEGGRDGLTQKVIECLEEEITLEALAKELGFRSESFESDDEDLTKVYKKIQGIDVEKHKVSEDEFYRDIY